MEEAKMIPFPYTVQDGEVQLCDKIIVVDAAKVTIKGDFTDVRVLDEDGVTFTDKDLFVIEFNGHSYGSETLDQDGFVELINNCCVPAGLGQVITFADPADKTFGDAPFALGGTASSGLTVTYVSSNPAVISISGGTATVVGAGTAIITASQAGNGTFAAAEPVQNTVNVAKAAQTITFNALPAKNTGDPDFAPGATTTSGLTIAYTSATPAVATIVAGNIHIVGAGTSNITASQAGNANYLAATPVIRLLTVS